MSAIHRQSSTAVGTVVRDAVRAGLALPAGAVGAALILTGRPGRAARWQQRVSGGRGWTGGRVLARLVLGLPLDAAALVVVGYALFNSVRNFGYPIWYLHTDYHHAWGGPTMAGVWTVHALGWALTLYVLLRWPVRWIANGQRALSARLSARPSTPPSTWPSDGRPARNTGVATAVPAA
ncbi:hypothetical protein ABT247_29690 [Kitasatospora sp. NPDC001539]|uniref:hypothetical protein n=1 Tax=Kitasatospora sp. NPDC001539 TaxID=3154384 RepID=UPI00331F01AA